MLVRFFFWWFAQLAELAAIAWGGQGGSPGAAIIVDIGDAGELAVSVCQGNGRRRSVSLDVAARLAGRNAVLLRPLPASVLQKRHTVPAVAPGQMGHLLRHEIGRITPFLVEELLWRWDPEARLAGQVKAAVLLTMIPKAALAPALAKLTGVGVRVDGVLVGPDEKPHVLPLGGGRYRPRGAALTRGLAWACAGLGVVAVSLPFGSLAIGRHRTETGIAGLRHAVEEVAALRRAETAAETSRNILRHEAERGGDVLRFLASVTHSLPDDTFLTDISVRERHIAFSGRSASAPELISILSADPEVRGVAFSAPVTRVEGAARDIFSMQAEMGKP